jgi:hypothetical protein
MESNKIINGNCWVAYCDLLGFKKRILGFEQQYGVGHLDVFVKNFYSELLDKLKIQGEYWPDKVFTAFASDSFLFFTHDDSKDSFGCLSGTTKCFSWFVMKKSWPLRGAIGFGQLYADKSNNIFLGSGLIDAYQYAEKQNWIGITVTPKANSRLRELNVELTKRPVMFREYDVPVKRKDIKNDICATVEETECLFTVRIQGLSNVRGYVEQMQRKAMNDNDYEIKHKAKYENTLKFFKETK